jgi:hypothetical protein
LTVYNLLLVNLPLVIGMLIFLTRQQLAGLLEANFGLHVGSVVFTGIAIGFYVLWMVLYFPLRYKQYKNMMDKRK